MIFQGQAYWPKVLGKPQDAYGGTHKEWSIDVTVDEKARAMFKELGVENKIRNKGDDRGDFITFRRKELKADGTPSKPIRVVGTTKSDGKNFDTWPEDKLIGNGSTVRVKFIINEGDQPVVWKRPDILSLQVAKLVEYGDGEDFPEDDDESWAEGDDS